MKRYGPAALVLAMLPMAGAAAQQSTIRPVELPPSLPAQVAPPAPAPAEPEAEGTPIADAPDAILAEPAAPSADNGLVPDPRALMAEEIAERARTAALNTTLARSAEDQRQAAADARGAAQQAAEAAHQVELDAHAAAVAESERRHAAAMAEWRRRVAACEAGDRTACARD